MKIRTDKAILDNLIIEQDENTLTLSQENGFGFTINTPIEYEITTPSLQNITIAGSATVIALDPLSGPELKITIAGSGDIQASLDVKQLELSILGSGNTDIGTFKSLDITIAGSGDVMYSGNPRIQSKIPGSGKLRSR